EPVSAPPGVDLCLIVARATDGLVLSIEYRADRFSGESIGRMLGHYHTLLGGMVADPTAPVSLLGLLTDEERAQLREWNGAAFSYPDRCMHQLFEAEAARRPTETAVICGRERLTYGELDARSNQL